LSTIFDALTLADVGKITRLVEMLHRSKIQFVRLEANGLEISISKGVADGGVESRDQEGQLPHSVVLSSHVGVFRSGAPTLEQVMPLGALVDTASVLGFIQTLDEINAVYAGVIGKVSEALVKDGDFVEFGQPLYRILPAMHPSAKLHVKDDGSGRTEVC
jgi:acetyl-CoA carboxylase biotin carboxyl carrier protein